MASDSEIKRREAIALDRVTKAAENLSARFQEIDAPTIPIRHRYPELLPLIRMEALADFLDALDAAMVSGEPAPDASTAPPANDDADKVDQTPSQPEDRAADAERTKQDARTAVFETIKQAPAKPKGR